jgi:protein-disulfide isomerase
MNRRFLVALFKGTIIAVVLLCLGCRAQIPATVAETNARIEKQVRMQYEDRIPPEVQILVGDRKPSELPGYDTVTITFARGDNKQTQDYLVSKDGKTLASFKKWDITKDPYAALMSKIDLTGRPYKGLKDAKVVIVNYDDFQCPYCSRMHTTMNEVMQKYGDRVKLVYKDFPLVEIHPWAMRAAMDGNCLAEQSMDAYWSFADYVHLHGAEISGPQRDVKQSETNVDQATREQGRKFNLPAWKLDACMAKPNEKAIRASMEEASDIGVQSTPTIFVNGQRISGALPVSDIEVVINRALRDAGQQVPAAASAQAKSDIQK